MANIRRIGSGLDRQGAREYTVFNSVPSSFISQELEGIYGNTILAELSQIIGYYDVYENGAEFNVESGLDYEATEYRSKQSQKLINKEARFMFATAPDITIDVPTEDRKQTNASQSILQDYVDAVIQKNALDKKLLAAAKDCFIGKRVAYIVNFNERTNRITISFIPSLGFVYDVDDDDAEFLNKLVVFYALNDSDLKDEQRIYKKKYWMEDGYCHIEEGIYDGMGIPVEEPEVFKTEFTYIPGGVILNDGLTGDMSGVSEIEQLFESESWYNKVSSSDIDSERKNMNPITYSVDIDPRTTVGLSRRPGAYWDLQTDDNGDGQTGKVGMLESSMNYSTPLANTLERIRQDAYEQIDMPDVSAKALQGVVSSGKTLKAIYWSLMVRCDEKFLAWKVQLEHMVRTIIDGGKLFPQIAKVYSDKAIPDVEYEVLIENNYPIQDDTTEEKEMDLAEVHNGTMSKKAYMQKWRGLSDDEVVEELKQMALERQYEDTAYFSDSTVFGTNQAKGKGEEIDGEGE